jgi:hypothetical protein
MSKITHLANQLGEFSKKYELPVKISSDGTDGELGIPYDGKLIFGNYTFDESEDGYELAANLGKVSRENLQSTAKRLVTSEPVRGVSERISEDGTYSMYSSRDNLKNLSAADIQKGFMDDVFRTTQSYEKFKEVTKKK